MTVRRRRALVVVLGDLARSPRMLLHAESLRRMDCDVELAGFGGTALPPGVADDAQIRIIPIAAFEAIRSPLPVIRVMAALLRQLLLAAASTAALARAARPDLILLQNPPAFPALPLLLCFNLFWRATLVIDWHNTTEAMFRLRLGGAGRGLTRLVATIETWLARFADAHLAASHALAALLRDRAITAKPMPDRAAAAFVPRARAANRVATVVAPTSWGADEDFSILLETARLCEDAGIPVEFLVTGRGERRAQFERTARSLALRTVTIRTAWFEAADYPRALASADIGLSLHRPASGADLPMKVPEMLACGVPVCALDTGPALRETMRHGEHGFFFSEARELAAILQSFCAAWPDAPELERLRASLRASSPPRWHDEWDHRVRPLVEAALA